MSKGAEPRSEISVRPLTAAEAPAYRALRRKIFDSEDARYFSDSFERERRLSERDWPEWCTEKPDHCILGTFAAAELVGIIMITRQGGPGSPVVEWEVAWLDPRYRGIGIGKTSYERAREWTKAHGYTFVVGFMRATYTPAREICRDLGFVYAYTIADELWADGSVADTQAFLLDLRADASKWAALPVRTRFRAAFPFLLAGLHAPPGRKEVAAEAVA